MPKVVAMRNMGGKGERGGGDSDSDENERICLCCCGCKRKTRRILIRVNLFLWIGIPIAIFSISCIFGPILAAVEGWKAMDGIEYVLGILCNVELIQLEPAENLFGELMEALIALWATTISALVIGFVGAFGFAAQIGLLIERGKRKLDASAIPTSDKDDHSTCDDGDEKVDAS